MLCYAVRHAESLVNAGLSRDPDCDLTELGLRQAESAAERMSVANIRAIYCSPYLRALRTAEPLARRLNLPIRVRMELREYHPQVTDALRDFRTPTPALARERCPAAQADPDAPAESDAAVASAGGEPFESVCVRTRSFAECLKRRWTAVEDAVAVFSHGSPVARLVDGWLSGQPGPSFRFIIDNAALNVLRFQDGVSSLICLNEASHLAALPVPALGNFNADRTVRPAAPVSYW